MVQNQTSQNNPQQSIILDLSLFIVDLLDKKKIQENATIRGNILEVPSAFVQMLRDSRVGSPVLFLFIHSLLTKTIEKYRKKQTDDPRILNLINNPDYAVRRDAWRITEQLYDEFASLIDLAPKLTLSENEKRERDSTQENVNYPIRRYDSIGSFSRDDQRLLQEIYTKELNLPEHPLYDQYFSQIFHAQSVAGMGESHQLRRAISLDEETFKIIAKWKGETHLEDNSNIVKVSKDFLKWFVLTFLKDELQDIAFGKSWELSVAVVLEGVVTGSPVLSLVTLAGETVLKGLAKAPPEVVPPEWASTLRITFVIVAILSLICIVIISGSSWLTKRPPPDPANTLLSTSTQILLLPEPTSTIPPIVTLTSSTSTEIAITSTILPVSTIVISDSPKYCLYVIQSEDTIQSVASWFNVSESDLRNSDPNINKGLFWFHQLIKVNAPCCTHFGINNGHSHFVQLQDNIFRLALKNQTTVEKIVGANNLDDSRYIQFGQMLCIPNP